MIAQLIYATIKDRAGSMGMRKTEQTINVAAAAVERTEQEVNVAAAADEQTGQETMVAAATMTGRQQTEAAAEAAPAKKADAASSAEAASDQREQTGSGAAAAAGVRRLQTEKQKDWTSRQTKQAGQAASVAAAASIHRVHTRSGAVEAAGVRREQTKQDEAGQPASRVPQAIQRNTRSRWSVAITTFVIVMMMSVTAGAAEHGLAQQMTTTQQLEWVSKLGEIQQTIDQLGELKRRDKWVQHTEAAEAQRIRTDRADATLQILGELNLNMRNEIKKERARVDLGRQIQFMRRLLDAEQQKE